MLFIPLLHCCYPHRLKGGYFRRLPSECRPLHRAVVNNRRRALGAVGLLRISHPLTLAQHPARHRSPAPAIILGDLIVAEGHWKGNKACHARTMLPKVGDGKVQVIFAAASSTVAGLS